MFENINNILFNNNIQNNLYLDGEIWISKKNKVSLSSNSPF